jgi:Uma2 family endonuclease
MNVALRKRMSLDEFLAWEAQQELRWEFDGFEPIAMVGATLAHNLIAGAAEFALRQRLAPPCRVFREGARLRLAHTLRYPDIMVVCSPVKASATEVTDPIVVMEVLSPGTAKTDRIAKYREYLAAPSIQRYVLLEQEAIAATVLRRAGDVWSPSVLADDEILEMPEIDVTVPLSEFYAGVELGT